MKITKDTKVSVDVRNCTPKQKGLVLNRFVSIVGDNTWETAWADVAKESAKFINLNYSLHQCTYTSECTCHNPKVISFKQFLKAANPYRGMKATISFDTPKQHKKAQKRLFKMGYKWVGSGIVIKDYGSEPITIDDNMDMIDQSTGAITITYSQFMNMELPEAKPEPLKYAGYEVIVKRDEIKVGCRTFPKDQVRNFFEMGDAIRKEGHSINGAFGFINSNLDKLNL